AAHVAGALSLRDAARVVALRSRALTALAGTGTMASVLLPAEPLRRLLQRWDGAITVAAVNGPVNTTISGTVGALDEFLDICEHDGIHARPIPVDYASHSPHVERIRDRLLRELVDLAPRPA